jgi:hypothetical protein
VYVISPLVAGRVRLWEFDPMRKYAAVLLTLSLSTPALARIEPFPPAFKTEMVATNGCVYRKPYPH